MYFNRQHIMHSDFYSTRDAISQFLFISDEPESVDLCVVLGSPSPTNIDPAIALYHAGLTKFILITGFGPKHKQADQDFIPEYIALRDRALQAKIPEQVLILETAATSTLENFTLSSSLIDAQFNWAAVRSIAIAGKPLHMRRALMSARQHWPDHLKLIMQPSKNAIDLQSHNWWKNERGRLRIFAEIRSIGEYALCEHIGGI